jgi:PiT family inorganic phosphate transporter
MSAGVLLALACGAFVAYLNGANDVSKGIATLAGSGVTSYQRAILWGTLWTGVGGLASLVLSQAMVATFGAGLLAGKSSPSLAETLAVLLGAAACVGMATRLSLPVSTTHAIVGSLVGVYGFSHGVSGINWAALEEKIVLPLLLSPVIALGLTVAILRTWRLVTNRLGESSECLCVGLEPVLAPANPTATGNSLVFTASTKMHVSVGSQGLCATDRPSAIQLTANQLHWLTSGATSFARGLNDTPKVVALVLVTTVIVTQSPAVKPVAFALVTLGMVAGSWTAGKKVTALLAKRVTPMDHREGFVANLVTAALVGPGAALGLPMSTTHVSSGAIIGVGIPKRAGMNWKTVHHICFAWVVTVPLAAALGVLAYTCLGALYAG